VVAARDVGQPHHEGGLEQSLLIYGATEFRGQVHQMGSETFPTGRYQVTGGLGDERGISHGDLPQLLLEAGREGFGVAGQDDSMDQRMN